MGSVAGCVLRPDLLTDELASQIEDRLGLPVEFADLQLGPDSVTLTDVRVATPEGDLELAIDQLSLEGDLLALARHSDAAVHAVRAAGATARFDLDHPAAAGRAETLRRQLSGGSEETEDSGPEAADDAALGQLGTLMKLLRDGTEIQIEDGALHFLEQGHEEVTLQAISGRVTKRSNSVFDARGEAAHRGGRLEGKLRADLETRSAAGELSWSELPIEGVLRRLPDLPVVQAETARTSGRAEWAPRGDGGWTLAGRAEVTGLSLESELLAETPIQQLGGVAEGMAVLDLDERRLSIERARLERRGAATELTGELSWSPGGDYRIEIDAEMPRTSCEAFLDAIPADLLGEYRGFKMGGELAGALRLDIDSARLKATDLDIDVDDDCVFEDVPQQADLEKFEDVFYHVVRGRDGEIVHAFDTGPGTPSWTPIEEVSPFFIQAVLAHEDAGFFRHAGFAVYAMEAALERNLEAESYVVGASTLSMQLAKNLFLARDKNLARKAKEVLLTWWLERQLSKREILELYVNVIEYGPEIFGIRHASAHYFGRRPGDLTPAEAVFLATSLPAPVARYRQYQEGRLWRKVEREISFLLRHMERKGRLDAIALEHGMGQLQNFEFYYGADLRPVELGLGQPGDLPFATTYAKRNRTWWRLIL